MRRTQSSRLYLLAAALLAATALGACQPAKTEATEGPRPVRAVTLAPVTHEDITRYPAVIKPRTEADLGFRLAGKVVTRLVETGSRVAEGAPLAQLDSADVDLQVRAAQAQLASAQADAVNTRTDFQRYAKLKQGEWTTSQEYDLRKTLLDKADAHVREVEASLNILLNSRQYTTLRADGPGVVTAVLVEPGQVVAAGQPAIRVARDGELEAVAHIPENKLVGLNDQQLTVELWSLPGVSVKGRLRETAPSADTGTRTFQARITLIDPPPAVQLGMTATLVAAEPNPATVFSLPLAALTQDGKTPAVWIRNPDDGRLSLRQVTVASYAGDNVIVGNGVKPGETVVTAGVHMLEAGQQVRVWTAGTP